MAKIKNLLLFSVTSGCLGLYLPEFENASRFLILNMKMEPVGFHALFDYC
jgi:hypothetical protein